MKNEINNEKLIKLGFSPNQFLAIGQGTIGINNVVSFTNESDRHSSELIPARFLAGFIPTFLLAEEIQKEFGIISNIRIFFPKNLANKINKIDWQKINSQMEITKRIVTAFQKKLFPSISIHFSEDGEFNNNTVKMLKTLAGVMKESADPDILESIKTSARRHGGENGENNFDIYIAHHPFGWQEAEEKNIFNERIPDIVINTLPQSERRFLQLRRSIRNALRNSGIWKTPKEINDLEMNIAGAHYLLLDTSEPTLKDAFCHSTGEILERLKVLKKQTGNDNFRKAKNDFERLINLFSIRTKKSFEEISSKSLSELLEVNL
ncbi:MAG TPA: hypothetical protein VF189_00305 [Patescibacteria group bacterium]